MSRNLDKNIARNKHMIYVSIGKACFGHVASPVRDESSECSSGSLPPWQQARRPGTQGTGGPRRLYQQPAMLIMAMWL